ncbi:MAG: nucleotidyltransferase domain-containing protein [Candidatus Methylacidiphilales bacterium]|nr:nucleotidyltransferase domain-containing protein [Candidatus Methylacidiphilales bacterium]
MTALVNPAIDSRLQRIVAAQCYPLLFATISGAHLYGFPSPDSDYDLRASHVLPLERVVGLAISDETLEQASIIEGLEMDIVSHDIRKFLGLLMKKNGYVLEQLLSPLIVQTTEEHAELKALAPQVITKHHAHHYQGFAHTQWKLLTKEPLPRVKPLLYVYRVLLTGIYLMRTGRLEANLNVLNETFRLPYLPELIASKTSGAEQSLLSSADITFHEKEIERLRGDLDVSSERSFLPESAGDDVKKALNDFLIRIRMHGLRPAS